MFPDVVAWYFWIYFRKEQVVGMLLLENEWGSKMGSWVVFLAAPPWPAELAGDAATLPSPVAAGK